MHSDESCTIASMVPGRGAEWQLHSQPLRNTPLRDSARSFTPMVREYGGPSREYRMRNALSRRIVVPRAAVDDVAQEVFLVASSKRAACLREPIARPLCHRPLAWPQRAPRELRRLAVRSGICR